MLGGATPVFLVLVWGLFFFFFSQHNPPFLFYSLGKRKRERILMLHTAYYTAVFSSQQALKVGNHCFFALMCAN